MSKSVNILRGDLHLMVSAAFTRGRYVLMTAGDGQPQEITIDLRERPDDLFESEGGIDASGHLWRVKPDVATDDHGPAIPAQGEPDLAPVEEYGFAGDGGPTRYEIQIQALARSARRDGIEVTLENVTLDDVLRWGDGLRRAERCGWVHVYDRVTRERRTLKRPEPSNLETGLRRLAEGLRGSFRPEDATHVESSAPLPAVGPLTSTEGLRAGDVVRCERWTGTQFFPGRAYVMEDREGVVGLERTNGFYAPFPHLDNEGEGSMWAFVGRPDADGWMTWAGGENPVPGAQVAIVQECDAGPGDACESPSDDLRWTHQGNGGDIVAFRIVDSKGGTTDT